MEVLPAAWASLHSFPLSAAPHETLLGEILGGGGGFTLYAESDDLEAALEAARRIAGSASGIGGVTGVEIGHLPGRPEVLFRLDPELASLLGLDPSAIADWVESIARGLPSTTFYRQDERVDVMVLSDEGEGVALERALLHAMPVAGTLVPLGRLVSIERRQLPGFVEHYQGNRAVSISISSSGAGWSESP